MALFCLSRASREQVGQRLQQAIRCHCPREPPAAAIEIEDELITEATSHLNSPLPSRSSMIRREAARPNGCREQPAIQ
jgi:hypothetical protein